MPQGSATERRYAAFLQSVVRLADGTVCEVESRTSVIISNLISDRCVIDHFPLSRRWPGDVEKL